jgi:hypothetical protein
MTTKTKTDFIYTATCMKWRQTGSGLVIGFTALLQTTSINNHFTNKQTTLQYSKHTSFPVFTSLMATASHSNTSQRLNRSGSLTHSPTIDCQTVAGLMMRGALSDERTGLPFAIAGDFASEVILGSECSWTRDHILLSQIRDFPFRRLLRLAGSRWRYSNQPPRGHRSVAPFVSR